MNANLMDPVILFNSLNLLMNDDDNDIELMNILLEKQHHHKIRNYYEKIIPLYSLSDFKTHFRMTQRTFGKLLETLAPSLIGEMNAGKATVVPEKQLFIAIWTFCNQEVYRSIADRFGVSKNTAWRCTIKVAEVLNSKSGEFIRWPRGRELTRVQEQFFEIGGFPNVIGAVDGSHIEISAPSVDGNSYVNRKGFHSLNLQGVCDAQLRFIDVFAGICGSVHDARVWSMSDIKEELEENVSEFCPGGSHILGDSAYGLKQFLMTPYKDRGFMTATQRNFNKILSRHRVVIERTFGLLKGRCRRLKYLYIQNVKYGALIIVACCVLHNICLELEDDTNEEILGELPTIENEEIEEINLRDEEQDIVATDKRDSIAEMLMAARRC